MRDLVCRALFDGNLGARSDLQVERGERSRHIEWHAVLLRQDGDRVGADLVRDIAIRGNAVRADHDAADATASQEMSGHIVGDQRGRNAVVRQLPGRQPRALQKRPCFIRENVDLLSGLHRRADHSERRPVARRRQRPRVAMRQHGFAIRYQRRAVAADGLAHRDVLLVDLLRFGDAAFPYLLARGPIQRLVKVLHPLDGPEEVHGRGPCGRKRVAYRLKIRSLLHAQSHSHRRRHADRRSAADHHVANGLRYLFIGAGSDILFAQRELSLIDHDYPR